MRKTLAHQKYYDHKKHAKDRGVQFLFSFDEWVEWWHRNLGDDWLKKRGNRKGKYVMARYGDEGPYAFYNVKCILHASNAREALKRRRSEMRL